MTTPAERVALGQRLTTKLAFLHAAHNFVVDPSVVNWRTLETAMQMHQKQTVAARQARILAESGLNPDGSPLTKPAFTAAQNAIAQVQALENERLGR